MGEKAIISYRYCDEQMARSKGIIGSKYTNMPRCRKDCQNCIACVEVYTNGNREHATMRGRKNAN